MAAEMMTAPFKVGRKELYLSASSDSITMPSLTLAQTQHFNRTPPHTRSLPQLRQIPRPIMVLQTRPPRLPLPRLQRPHHLRPLIRQTTTSRNGRSARADKSEQMASATGAEIHDGGVGTAFCVACGAGGLYGVE